MPCADERERTGGKGKNVCKRNERIRNKHRKMEERNNPSHTPTGRRIYIASFSAPKDIILRALARLKGLTGKMRDLSTSLINSEEEKDPVGEKVHQNRSGSLRRSPLWDPILVDFSPTGSFSSSELIRLVLESLIFPFNPCSLARALKIISLGAEKEPI